MINEEFLRGYEGQEINVVFVLPGGPSGEFAGRLTAVHGGIITMRCPTMDEQTKERYTHDMHVNVADVRLVKTNRQAAVALARGIIR